MQRASLREDSGESRLMRVRVREREGARINAMHVPVNHYPTNVHHKPFPDERRKNVRSASDSISFAMSFNRAATPPTHKSST